MIDLRTLTPRLSRHLTDDDLPVVTSKLRRVTLLQGQQLVGEGRFNDTLSIVAAGRLGVELEGGARLSLAEVTPGACVGEMTWVDPGPANATVRALEPSVVYQLAHVDLETLRVQAPATLARLLHAVSEDLAAHMKSAIERLSSGEAAADAPAEPKRRRGWGGFVDALAAFAGGRS